MQIQTYTPQYRTSPHFSGNLFSKVGKRIAKAIEPTEIINPQNLENLTQTVSLAKKLYNPLENVPVIMSVKNGNKEFSFVFNNSVYNKANLTRKGEEVYDFEILHAQNKYDSAFYSTGSYHCKISDEKFIAKFNDILEEWLPKLNKKYEKQLKA